MESFDHYERRGNSYGAIVEEDRGTSKSGRFSKFMATAACVLALVVGIACWVHAKDGGGTESNSAPPLSAVPYTHKSEPAEGTYPRHAHAAAASSKASPSAAPGTGAHPPAAADRIKYTLYPLKRPAKKKKNTRLDYLNSDDLAYFPDDVIEALNTSVDPCVDFYEYVCGRWIANSTIPPYQPAWAKQWDGVTKYVEKLTIGLLEKDKGPAGRFFQSCMDQETITALGAKPLEPWLARVDDIVDKATLARSLVQMAVSDMNVFWSWWVDADCEDASISSFYIAQGGISMPDRSYYLDASPSMQQHRQRYQEVLENLLILAGVAPSVAAADVTNSMQVETALAAAMTPLDAERDEHGRRYSVRELAALSPDVDWEGWFAGIGLQGVGTSQVGYLVVKNAKFLAQMNHVIKTVGIPKIRSYLRTQLVFSYAPFLDERFENVLLRWSKNLYGITVLPPRQKKCYFSTAGAMDMPVSKLFVDAYFPEASRDAALEMLAQIRDQFNSSLAHKAWMDSVTREKAVYKLGKMFMEVGHPTVWPAATFETFEAYGGIDGHGYFNNCLATNAWDVNNTIKKTGSKVDRRKWGSSSATDVNSFYNRKANGIFIPAGILQQPFYAPDQPAARSYGSVGAICGHEMTHGFDDVGREYDAAGNRNAWWTPQVVANFKERAKCISELFSSFVEYGVHVNGRLTLGESIADRGGIKFAWEAFVANHQPDESSKRLFFVAMGQTWCEKTREKSAKAAILTDEHPPNKFRVIGTLSQFAPFAEAYKCPVGSPMAPKVRCDLW